MKSLSKLLAGTVVLALVGSASAATYKWDGGDASSDSWQDADNWDAAGIPPASSGADTVQVFAVNVGTQYLANWDYSSVNSFSYGNLYVTSTLTQIMTLRKSGSDTLDVGTLRLQSTTSSTHPAVLEIDADNMSADATLIRYYADIDIAADKEFHAGALELVSVTYPADLQVTGASSLSKLFIDSFTGNSKPLELVGPVVFEVE